MLTLDRVDVYSVQCDEARVDCRWIAIYWRSTRLRRACSVWASCLLLANHLSKPLHTTLTVWIYQNIHIKASVSWHLISFNQCSLES